MLDFDPIKRRNLLTGGFIKRSRLYIIFIDFLNVCYYLLDTNIVHSYLITTIAFNIRFILLYSYLLPTMPNSSSPGCNAITATQLTNVLCSNANTST